MESVALGFLFPVECPIRRVDAVLFQVAGAGLETFLRSLTCPRESGLGSIN